MDYDCGARSNAGRLGMRGFVGDFGGDVGGVEILREDHVTCLAVSTARNQYPLLKNYWMETGIG